MTITIDTVTMPIEAARSVEWAGVNVAEDLRAVRARETTYEQLLGECLDGCEPEHEGDWRDYVDAVWAAAESAWCQSGTATGEPCTWTGDADDLVTVEWMPEHLRASHEAAGNWGSYPHNGAERLRCCPACAEELQADDADEADEDAWTYEAYQTSVLGASAARIVAEYELTTDLREIRTWLDRAQIAAWATDGDGGRMPGVWCDCYFEQAADALYHAALLVEQDAAVRARADAEEAS